jgi:RNA polymerase sigma factor (TIGR02999 family)
MRSASEPTEVTVLLRRWRGGDEHAYDRVVSTVYERLLAIAAGHTARERHATSPSALVSEAYLRLREIKRVDWKDRNHFFAFASLQMRRILVEHARHRNAGKREGGRDRIPLSPDTAWSELPGAALIDLNNALDALNETDPNLVRLVELRYLMGYNNAEISLLTGASDASVERHLRFARAWLSARLNGDTA